jgi:MFS family permease
VPLDETPGRRPHFDVAGSVALAVALGALIVLIERGGHGRLSLATLTATALMAVGAFGAFLRIEVRAPEPTADLRLFRRVAFSAGLAASFLNFMAMASNMFLMPFFLQEARGMSAGGAGAVMMVMPVGVLVAAPVAGKMADRMGSRLPATLGMALIAAAIGLMATFTDGVAVAEVAAVLLVYGIGAGLFQSPNISGVLAAAPADRLGVASGTLSTLGRLGQVVGVVVAGGLWQQGVSGASSGAAGFRPAFVVLALFGVLATVASWLRGPVRGHACAAVRHLPVQPG